MNILITAPSLDTSKNVSGISTVVNTIIDNNDSHSYYHYLLGRPDNSTTFFYLFLLLKQIFFFPIFVKKKRIDLVHQNLPFDRKGLLREVLINFWCCILSVPVVLHIHGGEFLQFSKINVFWIVLRDFVFKQSNRVVVLSELEKKTLEERHNFYEAEVLPNSIDVLKYKFEDRIYSKEVPTILFLGRIHRSKGLDDILESFKILKERNINFKFILCGRGPEVNRYITEFETILKNDFRYEGIVSGNSKIKVLHIADYLILPSHFEGLPMSLLEGMASGLVPIVTNVGSMGLLVKNKVTGLIVEKNNPKDIADVIYDNFENERNFYFMSKNASLMIINSYSIYDYISNLNIIYSNCIHKHAKI